MLIDEDDLSAILDHSMTSVAEKGKDSLVRIALKEATQAICHLVTLYDPRFYQRQLLIRSESESGDNFIELALIVEYTRQVTVCLHEFIFLDFGQFPDIVKVGNTYQDASLDLGVDRFLKLSLLLVLRFDHKQ